MFIKPSWFSIHIIIVLVRLILSSYESFCVGNNIVSQSVHHLELNMGIIIIVTHRSRKVWEVL